MTDYERLEKIATHLSALIDFGSFNPSEVITLQEEVSDLSKLLIPDDIPTGDDAIVYECQALIYWLQGDRKQAREFAEIAASLSDGPLHTTNARAMFDASHATPRGVGGWLMLFSVGIVLSIIASAINIVMALSMITVFQQYGYAWWPILNTFQVIVMVIIAISYFVYLAKRSPFAKYAAISYISFVALINAIDLLILFGFYEAANLTGSASDAADFGRALLACAIWIPYFLVSKRVKHTLTK